MGMSSVKVLLNGVNSTETELSTLSPQDIAKIEVYDTPPARFAAMGLTCVVNIVTRKNLTGGSVGINLLDGFHPVYGDNTLGLSYNHGNSRWSFNYANTLRRNKKDSESQELSYTFDGQEYSKKKEGIDSPLNLDVNTFQLGYMNRKQDSYQFNVTGGFEVQGRTENYAQNVTYSNGKKFLSQDFEDNDYKKYTLDLYYNKTFNKHNELLANLTGTYYDTKLLSRYDETDSKTASTYFDSYSNISSRKPSFIADLIYSHSMTAGTLSFGIRDYWQHNSQDVATGETVEEKGITSLSNQLYAYGEFSGKIKQKFYYRGSLGIEHSHFKKDGANSFSSTYLRPRLALTYLIKKNLQLSATYQLAATSPSLSMLSETPIWVDNKYIFQGNANLRPYKAHYFLLGSYWSLPRFTFVLNLNYYNAPNAVLPYFKNGEDAVIQTYANMNRAEQYDITFSATWYPFKSKVLMLSMRGWLTRYVVDGTDYKWNQNGNRIFANIQLNLEKFSFEYFHQSTTKIITGQLLQLSPSADLIEFYYKPVKGMSIGISWRYPFYKAYKDGTETHPSALVHSITRRLTKDYANMLCLCFSYNFSFGKNTKVYQKKMNNEDTDSGILLR
jgi:outer membrane receptor protein involved in Fe transport